jgi:gentisate 1,2-dioxygenase
MDYIRAYEYEGNVNPKMNKIPIERKHISECEYGLNVIDFSNIYNVNYEATSPNLLASFIRLDKKSSISKELEISETTLNASSHLFYIINGDCQIQLNHTDLFDVSSGSIFVAPFFTSIEITNQSNDELHIYYVNDSPLLNYLGSNANRQIFSACVYSKDFLLDHLEKLSNPKNNRKGILLSNEDTEKKGTNTITPILWALYNELPPNTNQRPHKHNSVALDFCIRSEDPENIYTLVGDELDENGNIVNPKKINWKTSEMFITPPGLWHSHHNQGNTYAYILPIQDAGILLYQRILGIVLT